MTPEAGLLSVYVLAVLSCPEGGAVRFVAPTLVMASLLIAGRKA